MKPNFAYEKSFWKREYRYVIGVDEVGRGAFAGPVVAAAVIFSPEILQLIPPRDLAFFKQIDDSKKIMPNKRTALTLLIKKIALLYSIASVPVSTINTQGIVKATATAVRKAVLDISKKIMNVRNFQNKSFTESHLLVDGFYIPHVKWFGKKNQTAIVKGDEKSITIAAASIIAKVYRDQYMSNLDKDHPEYGFSLHKGYGTKMHIRAIKQYGFCEMHRTSFHIKSFCRNSRLQKYYKYCTIRKCQ